MKFKKFLSTVCASTLLFSSIFCCKAEKPTYKVVFVGDSGTGKTTIINKLIGSQNTESGITNSVKSYDFPTDTNRTTVLYDTPGRGNYIGCLKKSFPKTNVLIICLDSNPDTYQDRLSYWLDFVRKAAPQSANAKKVVVLKCTEDENMLEMKYVISSLVGSCPIIPWNATDDAGITILRDYLSKDNLSLPLQRALQRCAATCDFTTST